MEENRLAYQDIKQFLANRKGTFWDRIKRFVKEKLG